MNTHEVYVPCTRYIMRDGSEAVSSIGPEEVSNACVDLKSVMTHYGCMSWRIQGKDISYCPYCGTKLNYLGNKVINTVDYTKQ